MKSITPNTDNVKRTPIRVALYCRVSTDEQETSIQAQLANLESYCKTNGLQITKRYVDEGYSGSTDERPQYKLLFQDSARGLFDAVIVWKQDRFSRNLRNLVNGIEIIKNLGIKFISASENLDTSTPHGQFAVQIMGTIAEFERSRIAERTSEAYHQRVREGRWGCGRPPKGYRWLKDEKRIEIIPDEAEIVRLIFNLYALEGMGMVQIARRLTNEGYKRWNHRTIHLILHQSAYMGKHRLGQEFPPIISQDLWNRTQTRLREARRVRQDPRGWLLQGLIVCGDCGRTLSCESVWHQNYVCRGRYSEPHREDSRCTLPRVSKEWIEDAVMNELYEALVDTDSIKTAIRNARDELLDRRQSVGKANENVNAKLSVLKGKKERLALVFTDGALDEATYRKQLADLTKQETELAKRLENLAPCDEVELTDIEKELSLLTDILEIEEWHPGSNFALHYWQGQILSQVMAETAKECNLEGKLSGPLEPYLDSYLDRLNSSEEQMYLVKQEEHQTKINRKLMRLLKIRLIAYNDRVVLKGLLNPNALTILKDGQRSEAKNETKELCQVFNAPAKTEKQTKLIPFLIEIPFERPSARADAGASFIQSPELASILEGGGQ